MQTRRKTALLHGALALVAELVDALVSGTSGRKAVGVRVPSRAGAKIVVPPTDVDGGLQSVAYNAIHPKTTHRKAVLSTTKRRGALGPIRGEPACLTH